MSGAAEPNQSSQVRVVRVIARLNVGGPAIQAISLTARLEPLGYRTTLVRGVENPDEGNMDYLAAELGVHPTLVPTLRRDPGWHDLPALLALVRIIRRAKPDIVHTHAAKGGTLGRVAALLASLGRRRPVMIHTYHGHSLTGYFTPRTAAVYRTIERVLARFTDRLIAVSEQVRDELVGMRIAPPQTFEVVPLGFDLSPFRREQAEAERLRTALRAELGIPAHAPLVTLIARLAPIKRVDRFLRIAAAVGEQVPEARFLIVGDGELRDSLRESGEARQLGDRLTWAGFRRDMPAVCLASDVVVQTSDNEGTPVALIEAQAAGRPVVSTRVGGVAAVVADGESGVIVSPEDEGGFAQALVRVLTTPQLAERFGAAASSRTQSFSIENLINRIDGLYRRCLDERRTRRA